MTMFRPIGNCYIDEEDTTNTGYLGDETEFRDNGEGNAQFTYNKYTWIGYRHFNSAHGYGNGYGCASGDGYGDGGGTVTGKRRWTY